MSDHSKPYQKYNDVCTRNSAHSAPALLKVRAHALQFVYLTARYIVVQCVAGHLTASVKQVHQQANLKQTAYYHMKQISCGAAICEATLTFLLRNNSCRYSSFFIARFICFSTAVTAAMQSNGIS